MYSGLEWSLMRQFFLQISFENKGIMKSRVPIWLLLPFWLGCALVTYHNGFDIQQEKGKQKEMFVGTYSFGFSHLLLFPDQSFMFFESDDTEFINELSSKEKYKIYTKWGDDRVKWGRYQLTGDTAVFELYSKVNRYGIMKLCKWKGVFPNDSTLQILPGPVNLNVAKMMYRTDFNHNGSIFYANSKLKSLNVDPSRAWLNN